ncbi:hypothetical protein LJB95_00895 [Paludibacteraceae bacterium OttesenSCG-928-F17]|nr:hypothetical protein [Paludibacteraceae bacterium OttesenSCG-928-F17]
MKKKVPKGWICISEFEKLISISSKTITAAIKKGSIPKEYVDRIGKTATAPYYLEPQKSALNWYSSLNAKHPLSKKIRDILGKYVETFAPDAIDKEEAVSALGGMTLGEAQRREQIAKAKIAELRVQEMEGSLVDKEKIDEQLFNAGKELREALLAIPNRITDQVIAACDNRTEVLNIMYDAISSELERLSDLISSEHSAE